MEEKRNHYGNGKVYRLIGDNKTYVGSTTQSLAKRKSNHKKNFEHWMKGGSSQWCSSFDILSGGNYDIFLIEECPCDNKEQLRARERYWIEQTECINKIRRPIRTQEEREAYQKKYQEENEAQLKEYRKRRYEECDKQEKKRVDAEYYNNKKDQLLEKITCECGSVVAKCGITRHKKTAKHVNNKI